MNIVLPTTYFGPISWYRQLNSADTCFIDTTEPFRKRTFRNRCEIATPNGRQTLTVPVEHRGSGSAEVRGFENCSFSDGILTPSYPRTSVPSTIPITSLRISEHNKWRHVHWQALETAYGNSPFFDYYVDDIRPFFEPHWEYLFDLNLAIIRKMCELLQVETRVSRSEERRAGSENGFSGIEEKGERKEICAETHLPPRSSHLSPRKEYYQVHAHRTGFLPNLSILDLLFNMGNESILYL